MSSMSNFIVSSLLGITGLFISRLRDMTIKYKEKVRKKEYCQYRSDNKIDFLVNYFIIFSASVVAFSSLNLRDSIFNIIMVIIGTYAIRVDQKIRIIPNELVLLLLVVGILRQFSSFGFIGIGFGLLGMFCTGILFYITSKITKLLSGAIGVGAGDIKLAMAISFILGIKEIFQFWFGIAIFLLVFIIAGVYSGKLRIGSSFPMCLQIMGGYIFVLYIPAIPKIIEIIG